LSAPPDELADSDYPGQAEIFTPLHRALTARGAMVLGGALAVLACGLLLRYTELIGLGAVGVAAVLAALAMVGRAPQVTVSRVVDPARVTRGSPIGSPSAPPRGGRCRPCSRTTWPARAPTHSPCRG
jgi:hypothetical protein